MSDQANQPNDEQKKVTKIKINLSSSSKPASKSRRSRKSGFVTSVKVNKQNGKGTNQPKTTKEAPKERSVADEIEKAINEIPKFSKRDLKELEKKKQDEIMKNPKKKATKKPVKEATKNSKAARGNKNGNSVPSKKAKNLQKPKRKKQKEPDKRFFESGKDTKIIDRVRKLKNEFFTKLDDFTGTPEELQEFKTRFCTKITEGYEGLISEINKIDQELARKTLEKAVCLDALRKLTDFSTEQQFNKEVDDTEKKLSEESLLQFTEVKQMSRSLWKFSSTNKVLSEDAFDQCCEFLRRPHRENKDTKEEMILYTRKKCHAAIPKKDLAKDEQISDNGQDSTSPGCSSETMVDPFQNKLPHNKNVKIVIG